MLDIEVTLTRIGTKSLSYAFTFRLKGETIATGTISTVCCRIDPTAHRLEAIPIPAGIRARFGGKVWRPGSVIRATRSNPRRYY